VAGRHEISADGKALRYFEVTDFEERLTPERITRAVRTLRADDDGSGTGRK
jgi:ArsR family transcriptional regulator